MQEMDQDDWLAYGPSDPFDYLFNLPGLCD